MAKSRTDFTEFLIRKQILSPDQLEEARGLERSAGMKLHDAIVKLGYASNEQVMAAIAEAHGLQFVDLTEVTIPAAVIELVPESVARENIVLPMAQDDGVLRIIMHDPSDFDTVQKLQFILNKDIQPVLAPREQIIEAINRHYGLRLRLRPTVHGQSAVMRILDRGNIQVSIKDLGFGEEDYKRFQSIIKRPNGIFLVTGPTGSGKTTTLYAALNELNRPDRKIITAEDPVEYYLPGVNQVEVKHQIGLDFARIIRAMLRQAPNIILVGEIRDHETAEIAVQASLTGHLVFSTLHTNDAPSAITRLADIGVQPFLVASSVIAIMAQRLIRVICPKCKEPDQPPAAELKAANITPDRVKGATFMRGRGCNHCNHPGYRGRLGIFELMKLNSTIREMTFKREPTQTIRRQSRLLGMRTLLEDGVNKALKGVTTLEEVLSTCHHEAGG